MLIVQTSVILLNSLNSKSLLTFKHFTVVPNCLSFEAKLLSVYDVIYFGEKIASEFWMLLSCHKLAASISLTLSTVKVTITK